MQDQLDPIPFADTLVTDIGEAEVVCSAHILGRAINYTRVDARTGLSAGRSPLPCLIQDADGGLFHLSEEAAAPPDLPPVNEDYVKVLDKLYPKDSPQRIVLGAGQVPFFISIPRGTSPPDGYTVYHHHPPVACNWLGYNGHSHILCVHKTSKFAPRLPITTTFLQKTYRMPFQNKQEAFVNGLIKELISRRVDEMYGSSSRVSPQLIREHVYAPIVHLCNTSGSGKTRTALELGKYTNVVYIKYAAGNDDTAKSVTAAFLVQFIQEKCRNLQLVECYSIQHAALQRLIYICSKFCEAANYVEGSIELDIAVKWFCQSNHLSEDVLNSKVFGGIKVGNVGGAKNEIDHFGQLQLKSLVEVSFDGKSLAEIERLNSEWLKGRATSMPLRQESSKKECDNLKHLPNLVFVFDDAFSPMEKSARDESAGAISATDNKRVEETATDCYQILRGTLRHYDFYCEETLSITVSSVVNYTPFCPPSYTNPSFRGHGVVPTLAPIVLMGTFDAFNHGTVNSNDFKDWLSFIFSFERCLMIASCGRPLWAIEYGMMIGKVMQNLWDKRLDFRGYDIQLMKNDAFNFLPHDTLFELAAAKISPNIKLTFSKGLNVTLDDNTLVSLLSLSIAMTKFPCAVNSPEFVRSGGMCLFNIDSENFKAAFVSEGIFNGIASYVVVRYFNIIVDYLCKLFAKGSFAFIMKSEVGEIIERLLIIYSAVKARRSGLCKALGCCEEMKTAKNICRTVFEPVGLADFLVEYVGKKAADKYMESCPGLEGSFVAFNHFDYMGGDDVADSPYDAVANYLSRGAALVSRSCTTILPLVLSDGRLSFVYIQTKMGSSQAYLKLPTAKNIRSSSPLSLWTDFYSGDLENWDPNTPIPPYAYIYHHINSSEHEFAVVDDEQGGHQQSCLAFSGIPANDLEAHNSVTRLVRLFEGMKVEPWLAKNSSMLRTWKQPSTEPYVRVDWGKYFSPQGPL